MDIGSAGRNKIRPGLLSVKLKGEAPIFIFVQANRQRRPFSKKPRARHGAGSTGREKPAITCEQEIDFLDRYLSADLNPCELAQFESHLNVCRDCVAFIRTYKTTLALTRSFLSSRTHAPEHLLKPGRKPVKRR